MTFQIEDQVSVTYSEHQFLVILHELLMSVGIMETFKLPVG